MAILVRSHYRVQLPLPSYRVVQGQMPQNPLLTLLSPAHIQFRSPLGTRIPPRSYYMAVNAEDQVWQNVLVKLFPQAPMTFRGPLSTRIHALARPTEGGPQPNRLLNLLKQSNETPFTVQSDWLNPTRKKLPTSLFDYTQSYTVNLPPPSPTVLPFTNTYSNPRWPAYAAQPQITRLPPTTGIDQFFDEPGRAPVYDWPVPKGYRYPTSLYTWAQDEVSSKLVTLVPVPIKTKDWPNPVFPTSFVAMRGWVDPTKLNLLGQDKFPDGTGQGSCYDWPNPRGYTYPTSLRSHLVNILSYANFTPFNMNDYPNPVILKYPMDLRTFLQGYENFMLTGKTPFNQNDQPNPRGYPYPLDGRSWMQSYDLSLIGQDTFYGKAGESKVYDYPNPLRYKTSYACYDPNFGWFIVSVPKPPPVGTVLFRKTFSPVGTGVGARKRRKDS